MSRLIPLALLLVPILVLAGDSPTEGTPETEALAAFAARDFESGIRQYRDLVTSRPDDPAAPFWEMMVVRGLALDGRTGPAAEAGAAALAARPDGPWSNAIRFLVADALVDLGQEKKAARTALAGLDALTAPESRARVADLYLDAARRAFAGVPVGEGPFRREGKRDFAQALALYRGARSVGIRDADRPIVAERIVRCLLAVNLFPDAAAEAAAGLEAHPKAANRPDLMALLAVGLARAGRTDEARHAVADLLKAHPSDVRAAEALVALGDLESLRVVRDRLADAPEAPGAAWRIAELLEKSGDAIRAIDEFRLFLHRYPGHERAAEGDFRIANILLSTGEFDAAAKAFSGHRDRFPLSTFWTRARTRAVDAAFLKGKALKEAGKAGAAFARWNEFTRAYPLDPRVPGILYAEGDWHAANGRAEKAYAAWHGLRSRYRGSSRAAEAALRIAQLFEETVGDMARAVTEYRTVVRDFAKGKPAKEARRRLSVLQQEGLSIRLPRPFRSEEEAYLEILTRNVETVTARVYDLDLAEYFRRRRTLAGLADVLVDVIKPDEVLTRSVPDYEQYREASWHLSIPRKGPGGAIVVVEGGSLRAVTLLLVSDISVITKEWKGGALAFVQDARTGEPLPGVEIYGNHPEKPFAKVVTGEDGVARIPEVANPVRLLAVRGDSVAGDEFEAFRREVRGAETLVHVSTDRPLYRPGHTVSYRAIVRRRTGDHIVNPAGAEVSVLVEDKVGNDLHDVQTTLSVHGTTHGAFLLPDDLPPGDYRVTVTFARGAYHGAFRVEEYTKPDILLSFTPERPSVIHGETIRGTVRARYAFGKPIAGLTLNLTGQAEPVAIVTDAAGEATVEIPGDRLGRIGIELRGRDVARRLIRLRTSVLVAKRGYSVALTPDPARLTVGEELRVSLSVLDPLGEPVARKGRVRVLHAEAGADLFKPVLDPLPVESTDAGLATLRLTLQTPGRYRLRYEGVDRRGGEVAAECAVEVLAARDLRRVVVKAARERYGEGETAQVAIHAPSAGYALMTLEGERVYGHRVVRLGARGAVVPLELDASCVPEVRIRVALAHGGELWTGDDHVRVVRELHVTVRAGEEKYRPGDVAVVHVTTTDGRGKPVSAELALAVVDEAIYALREDRTIDLARFFTPPVRADLVRTGSSLDFQYEGVSSHISMDLMAERERRKKRARDSVMLDEDAISDAPFDGPSTNAAIGIGGGAGGRFSGRGGRRNLRAEGGGGTQGVREAAVRKDFADTAYWSGSLVTGPDGKATVTFRVPDNLTTWRVTGRAVTVGGGSGDGFGSFRAAKDLAILVSIPPVMRDGDVVTGAASLHNDSGEALDATVSLEAREALYGPFAGTSRSLAVGADASLDWRLEAPRHGRGLVIAGVRAGDRSDAEQRTVRVLPYGVPTRTGIGGMLDAPVDWRFDVPADVVPGTLTAELRLAPSVTAQVLAALDHLDVFPYGCVEQTVNRFYPALVTARALKALGRDEPRLRARLDEVVRAGIRRLSYLQQHQGEWGWWRRGRANSWMTAYATLALATAAKEGYAVPNRVLDAARGGIGRRLESEKDEDLRAFLRYAMIAGAKKPNLGALADSYVRRSKLETRGLAWLALAYASVGGDMQARTLAADLVSRIEVTRSGARVRGLATGSRLEASGLALQALLAIGVEAGLADQLATGLASARRDGSFGTTVETGTAVVALAAYVSERGGGEAGYVVEARVNDAAPVRIEIGSEEPDRERIVKLPTDSMSPGENRIRIVRVGGGRGVFALSVAAVARSAPDRDEGEPDLVLERRYALQADAMMEPMAMWADETSILRPGGARREPDVSSVVVGDVIRVTLDVRVRPGLRFLQVEDPLPAGFSALAGTASGPMDEIVLREDRMVFFVADPAARFRITYFMRTGFPGEMRVPPGRVFPMYRPAIVAHSAAREIQVILPGLGTREFAVGQSPPALLTRARRAETSEPATAARYARIVLERYDLEDEWASYTLRLLARVSERLGRPADVVDAYDRLSVLMPGWMPALGDAIRLARAAVAVDRPADAIHAVRRAASLLYERDRRALTDLGDRIAPGPFLESLAGRYPFGPSVEADLAVHARRSADRYDEETAADQDGSPALLDSLELTRALYPTSPGAADLALRHARSRLREGDWVSLEREAALAGELYPRHPSRAEADWFHAYAVFAQGRYEEAIRLSAKARGRSSYRLANGKRGYSAFRRNHVHLLAQAHHILGDMEKALEYYKELRTRSADAAAVVRELTDTALAIPSRMRVPVGETPTLRLRTRNLAFVNLRAYPIDLLSYFAIRKDLAKLRTINLDGLAPAVAMTVKVAGWRDREKHETALPLDLKGPGVFLVLAEAGGKIASGVILVSDLTVKVWSAGPHEARARVVVTNVRTGKPVKGAYVKVAHGGEILASGITDPRGVFDTVSVVRSERPSSRGLEEMPEVIEEIPLEKEERRLSTRVMVVVEKDGHAAAWW